MASSSSEYHQMIHFVLFPFMAQGHTIPIIDMAKLFAQRGIIVTIITTHLNSLRFKTIIDRSVDSGLPIRLLLLRFPCSEAGLPQGCENSDSITKGEDFIKFFTAIRMLQEPLEQALEEMKPKPDCIISDMCFPWTTETANKLKIPRLVFHGTSCFSLLCTHNILQSKVHESITSELEPFLVPNLPDQIYITKAELPGLLFSSAVGLVSEEKSSDDLQYLRRQIEEADMKSYGVLVNSFEDLEPKYYDAYLKVKSNKVWCIGPVSLSNKERVDKVDRGDKASVDENECLKWLDSKNPNSVVYVCFGSLCRLTNSEMIELGLGLEASGYPFMWVIRDGERYSELEKWLSDEKFEERTKDRSLIIKGWAPQVLILSHKSIGGFLTHCGWNSILEGICEGVPLITWPMFAEQFFNEKFVVDVLGIGVRIKEHEVDDVGEETRGGESCEESYG